MKRGAVKVTSHALLTYLEQVVGIDIEAHRTDVARKAALALEHDGATGVIKDGFRYKMSGGFVVGVYPVSMPDPRTSMCDRRQLPDQDDGHV